jgi:hypothetical protein
VVFLQDFGRGAWTARTETPTPVGIMFHNTDLFHYGYKLNRSSVPLCHNTTSIHELDRECLTSKGNSDKFDWDKRDFVVDVHVVIQFIEDFVLRDIVTCKELKAKSRNEIVLYNVWCKDDAIENAGISDTDTKLHLRHYYRKQVSN